MMADDPIALADEALRQLAEGDFGDSSSKAYVWIESLAVALRHRASPPPDEGIARLIEQLTTKAKDYSGITRKCEECYQTDGHELYCICLVLLDAAATLRAVRDGRREEPAK